MFSWILALLLAVTCFVLATGYLWLVKRRRKEMQLGLQALAGMHWRNFSELVKRALHERRGLTEMSRHEDDTREPRSDFLMADASGHFLVTCKHGLAYRIGTAAINELGAAARLAGARGGILITEGLVDGDGQAIAEKQAVEVLRTLHLVTGHRELLFPGERSPKRPMSNNTILAALDLARRHEILPWLEKMRDDFGLNGSLKRQRSET